MKRIRSLAAVLALAVLVACSANKAAFVSVGATKVAVDTAARAWVQNVAAKGRCPAASAPQPAGCVKYAKEAEFRDALKKYKDTAATLGVVLQATNTAPTPQQLAAAAESLISLVESFTGKKVPR